MKNKQSEAADSPAEEEEGPIEIGFVGDLTENQTDLCDKLLSVPVGGECTLYFDSPGGSPYGAICYANLIIMRELNATGVVAGECSSSALWPLAACRRRIVTPLSVLLFHPMKSQTEEHLGLDEAAEWARHFAELERDMDIWLGDLLKLDEKTLSQWMKPGRYVSGKEFADAGLAELLPLNQPIPDNG